MSGASRWRRVIALTAVAVGVASRVLAQTCGDVDGNGGVTVADGVQTLRAAAGLASGCTVAVCDVDGGGTITLTDGILVLRAAAGLSDPLECQGAKPRIFTMTNARDGNAIVAFSQNDDGRLTEVGRFATGGRGVEHGLENQGGVALTGDRGSVLVVNPGSDDFSVLRVVDGTLEVTDVAPSGGALPVSVAERGGLIYVLHREGGGGEAISGFRLQSDGTLAPIAGSTTSLSAPVATAAQVALDPDGRFVVVTEIGTSMISVFFLDGGGIAGDRRSFPSAGSGPFGFAFRNASQLYVSEAGSRSTSAYELGGDGSLRTLSAAVPSGQSAPCWVAITPDARTAFVANTGSHSISTFAIADEGTLTLLDAAAVTTDGGPLDLIVTADGRFLDALTTSGALEAFRIDAASRGLTRVDGVTGLPPGTNGLAGF